MVFLLSLPTPGLLTDIKNWSWHSFLLMLDVASESSTQNAPESHH